MPSWDHEIAFGAVKATSSTTGAQTNTALYAAQTFRDQAGTSATDTKAEWVLIGLIVTLSAAGNFKLTDGSSDLTPAFDILASTPLYIDLPVASGRGKGISYTTSAGNARVIAYAQPMKYSTHKPGNQA